MPSDKDSPTLDTDGWRRGRQQEGSLPPRTSHSSRTTQDDNGTSFTEEPSFSSPARAGTNGSPVPPTPSEVQRVRSFSSRDRHPWRHANSESPIKRQRELWAAQHQQHHDDDDASSDTASSYGHLSLPSDDCTGSSSTLPQSGSSPSVTIKSDEKSSSHSYSDKGNMTININKRHGNKCAAFTSDAAPYQVKRRDEDVLDHGSCHKSIHSIGNSSFLSSSLGSRSDDTSLSAFTPSVKIGTNETIFTNYQRLEDSNSDSESSSSSSSSTFSSSCSSSPSKKHARARGPSPENHPYMKLKQIRRTSPPLKTGSAGTAAVAAATPSSSSSSTMEQKELLSLPTFSTPTKSVIGPVSASHDKKKEAHSFIPAASPPPGQQQHGSSSTNIFRFGKVDDDFTGPSLEQAKPVSDDEDRIHRAAPNKGVGNVFRTRHDKEKEEEHTCFAPDLEVAKCISSDSNDVPSNLLLVGPFSTKEGRYEGSTRRTNDVQDGQVVLPKVDSTVVLGSSARQSSQHHFLETAAHPVTVQKDTKHVFRSSTNEETTFVAPPLEKGKPLSSMEIHSSSSTIFRDCSTVANERIFPSLEHARPLSSSTTHDDLEDGSNLNRSIFRSTGAVDMTERGLVPSLEKANPLSPIEYAAKEDGEQRQDNANKIEREPHVILDVISSPMPSYNMTSSRVDESSRYLIGGHGTPRPSLPKSSSSKSVQNNLLPPPSKAHSSSNSSSSSKPRGRRVNTWSGASMGSIESIETGPPSPQRTRPPHDVAAEAMTPERMQRKESGGEGTSDKEKKESSKTSLPSAMKRPSFGVGESNSSSSSAGVEDEDNIRKSPLRYDESSSLEKQQQRKVVTFPQTWLKRGDDYNEELFQKASLSSLIYKGDDDAAAASASSLPPSTTAAGEGMIVASSVFSSTVSSTNSNTNATTVATAATSSHCLQLRFPLTAPDSPDRSKSSLPSFSYSLDGTVGSGNSTSVERYGQEIKFHSKQQTRRGAGAGKHNHHHNHNNRYYHHHHHQSSNTNMSLAFLPKIDETRNTREETTASTIPVATAVTTTTTGTEPLFAVRNNNISPSSVITGATDHQQQRSTTSSSTTTSSSSSHNSKGTSSAATKDSTNSIRGSGTNNDDESSSTDHVLSPGGCITPLSSSSPGERPSATSIPVLLMQESDTVTSDEVSLELMLLMEKQKKREETNAIAAQEGNVNVEGTSIASSSQPSNNNRIPIIEGITATATAAATQGQSVPLTDAKKKESEEKISGGLSAKKATEGGQKPSTLKWKLKPKPNKQKETKKSSFVQPSPRDLILQRRKRMASPETNSILQQEDSSWEESNKIIIPNTIVVEHPSKQPPGNSQKEDSSPGSYSIETSTDKSGSEQHKTTTPLVVLHVDGMSLIERDGQTSMGDYEEGGYTIDDDEEDGDNNGGSNGQFGEYGYPEYPNDPSDDPKNSKDEVSSKCTSYFSARRSEDLSQLIPKEHDSLTPPKTDIGYHCARNRVVIVIVISALIAVGASATVVALLLFRSSSSSSPVQESSPTSSAGGNENKTNWPIPPTTTSSNNNNNPDSPSQNDWPEVVLWSPEEEVNSGGLIDDLLNNNGEVPTATTPFDRSEWIPFGQTIPLTFDKSSSTNTVQERDMTFDMSGNGQFLAVGVPFDTNQNGVGAGAVFLYQITSSSSGLSRTQNAASEEEGNEDLPKEEEQQWGLVGLLLGTKEGSGFGSNVVLNDDGSTIVTTSLGGENLIHVFHIEPITKQDVPAAAAASSENLDDVNARRHDRRHLRGNPSTQGRYLELQNGGGGGTTRKHEELYQHRRFPDLVHNVKFISKALNHPTLPKDIMLHHASVSISDDGTTVGIVAAALAPSQEQLKTFQSLAIFSYDQESDIWIDMKINVPSDFQPQYSWSCDLSGDGMTLAHSSVLMNDDSDGDTTNHVMLWHWKESTQTWDHAELFSSDLFDKKMLKNVKEERTTIDKERQRNRLSQQFGYSVSLNVDGTVLAIGAPSIIDRDNRSNNNEQLDLGYAVVARAIVEDPTSSNEDTSSTGTKVWGLAGDDVLKGTSFGFGRYVDLSKDGQRLVVGSPDHSVVTGGVTNVYQFMESDNRWMKAPNFHLMDPSNIGLGNAISSDGTKVMTGIGIPTMFGNTAEEVDDHDVITQKAFVEVYTEKKTGE